MYIIGVKEDASSEDIAKLKSFLSAHDAIVVEEYDHIGSMVVQFPSDSVHMDMIASHEAVEYIEKDQTIVLNSHVKVSK